MKITCFFATVIFPIIMILTVSCSPNCKEITLQVPDWQTRYEDYWVEFDSVVQVSEMVDTVVAYTVENYYTRVNYKVNSSGDETGSSCTHYITIRNTNDTYSNRFAIRIDGKEYNEAKRSWKDMSKSTNYVTIYPNNAYTFQITHSNWWHNRSKGYSEDDVDLYILQYSKYVEKTSKKIVHINRKKTRRIDELKMKDTIVNNCDCDVDAIKTRSEAVREVFESLKNQNLIHSK